MHLQVKMFLNLQLVSIKIKNLTCHFLWKTKLSQLVKIFSMTMINVGPKGENLLLRLVSVLVFLFWSSFSWTLTKNEAYMSFHTYFTFSFSRSIKTKLWEGETWLLESTIGTLVPNMFWNNGPSEAVLPLVPSLVPVHPQALSPAPNIWNYEIQMQRNPVPPDPYTLPGSSYQYSSESSIWC